MATETKTATKATKAKRKKRIPNMDSDSPTFFLCDRTPDPDQEGPFKSKSEHGAHFPIYGPATYLQCWRMWRAFGGQRNGHLAIMHNIDVGRALPIPQEFEGSEWDELADHWEELVNADCRPLEGKPDPLEFHDWPFFYVCRDGAILFGLADYTKCLTVLNSEQASGAIVVCRIRMSRALPAPKTEAELEQLLAAHPRRPGEVGLDQLLAHRR